MKIPVIFSLLALSTATPITLSHATEAPTAAAEISPEALGYLNRALDLLQSNSIKRAFTDWTKFRALVIDGAKGAQTSADTYPALRAALERLGEFPTALMTPAAKVEWVAPRDPVSLAVPGSPAPPPPMPRGELLAGYGYVAVPGLTAGNVEAGTVFADAIVKIVTQLDSTQPHGWIVDLRENAGGNMWPMLVGLGALTGDGEVGGFSDPYGKKNSWWYHQGSAGSGTWVAAKLSSKPYQLRQPAAPVAVLTSSKTASSGEGIVVSFIGRPATRTFGEPTGGNSNVVSTFALSDGATLFVTSAVFADRTGKTYGKAVTPDVIVPSGPTLAKNLSDDATVQAAVAWLKTQTL